MAFRFDMKDKTPQQQIIVAKRDTEDKIRKQEIANNKMSKGTNAGILLVVDKDICPDQDNIIAKQQCDGCEYYKEFKMYNGQPCISCLYKQMA